MTRTVTLSAHSYASLMKAANAISDAVRHVENITVDDSRQGDLFEDGADQACEDFVAERVELKLQIERLTYELVDTSNALHRAREERDRAIDLANGKGTSCSDLKEYAERLEAEVSTANAVLKHIADFANQLQAGLGKLGISYQADAETGEPRFSINLRVLDEAVRDMIHRS